MKTTITALTLLLSINLYSAETDHFSNRDTELPDMSQVINKKANKYMAKAIDDVNKQGPCDDSVESEKLLYTELQKYFANHSNRELAKELLAQKDIVVNAIPLKESVYQNLTIPNGYLLGRKKAATSPLAPMVRIGDQVIGTDKLEHMFGSGFRYFSSHYLKGKTLLKVLKTGVLSEKTTLGGNVFATGVFAYSDLSANFNGMRF
jgi:hypothetical protein